MMQLLSCLPVVIFGVILQISPTTEAAFVPPSTQHESGATSVNSSENLTAASSADNTLTGIHSDYKTTTESGSLTTDGKTHWTTSQFTENGTLMTSSASTHNFSSETVTASHGISDTTSAFSSTPPTTKQTKTTDSFSTSALYISTASVNAGTGTRFDAASFLGGIVLAFGLCVIAVFGYQFYKNRKSTSLPYRIVDE